MVMILNSIDQGCSILSGDIIISHLSAELKPQYVSFLTDVDGVFDRPPEHTGAILLDDIQVDKDGALLLNAETTQNEKIADVTGGMKAKIDSSAKIAARNIHVFIASIFNEEDAQSACIGIKVTRFFS